MPTPSHSFPPLIGVFDSGLGGLSILRAIREHLPTHPLLYIADSGHAPYGDKGETFVIDRSLALSEFLVTQGARILVIACNTATTAAVRTLRERYPTLGIVGVEPGIKPAARLTRSQRIAVMATTGTLRSEKFRLLAQAHAAHVELHLQPCRGLADAIESGDLTSPTVRELVQTYCAPLRDAGVDTVVLGCTHYPFVAAQIQAALGSGVQLVDTSEAVARQTALLARQLEGSDATSSAAPQAGNTSAAVTMWTTGSVDTLEHVAREWLGWAVTGHPLPASAASIVR